MQEEELKGLHQGDAILCDFCKCYYHKDKLFLFREDRDVVLAKSSYQLISQTQNPQVYSGFLGVFGKKPESKTPKYDFSICQRCMCIGLLKTNNNDIEKVNELFECLIKSEIEKAL